MRSYKEEIKYNWSLLNILEMNILKTGEKSCIELIESGDIT